MPTPNEHLHKSDLFLKQYESTDQDFVDGRMVSLWLAALHLVQAVAVHDGVRISNHAEREAFAARHEEVSHLYRRLSSDARLARYGPTSLRMTADELERKRRRKMFEPIRSWAARQIGEGFAEPKPTAGSRRTGQGAGVRRPKN